VLPIAPSTYFAYAARRRNPDLRSDRAKRDARLMPQVQRVYHENFAVNGVRKIWQD
jgi:putative transposase